MCFNGKCLGCIPLETGSMIFAVINAVVWVITVVGSVIGIIINYCVNDSYEYNAQMGDINVRANNIDDFYIGVGNYNIRSKDNTEYMTEDGDFRIVYAVCGILIAVGTFNFLFAVFLCNGINKRNNGHIKVYFIYGIVLAIMSSIAVLVLGVLINAFFFLSVPIVAYGFILHMIKLTMDKFSSGEIYDFQHKRLVEPYKITP